MRFLHVSVKTVSHFVIIKSSQYVGGVKYDEKGLSMQLISLSMVNVIYFDWASLEPVQLFEISSGDETQASAVFKLKNQLFVFTIPWDSQFDRLFEQPKLSETTHS